MIDPPLCRPRYEDDFSDEEPGAAFASSAPEGRSESLGNVMSVAALMAGGGGGGGSSKVRLATSFNPHSTLTSSPR